MERINDSHYRLSSGREFYAHACMIGIGPDEDDTPGEFAIGYGYDGDLYGANNYRG